GREPPSAIASSPDRCARISRGAELPFPRLGERSSTDMDPLASAAPPAKGAVQPSRALAIRPGRRRRPGAFPSHRPQRRGGHPGLPPSCVGKLTLPRRARWWPDGEGAEECRAKALGPTGYVESLRSWRCKDLQIFLS